MSCDAIGSIDLDDGLVEVLRTQRRQQAAEQLAATSCEASDHVFTRPAGGPQHPRQRSRRLGGLTAELDLARLTAHGRRPTCNHPHARERGRPEARLERLGPSDPSVLLNLYSHVTPTIQREAAERIGPRCSGELSGGPRPTRA